MNQSKLVHAPVRGTIFRKWRFCLIWGKTASQDAPGRAIARGSDEEGRHERLQFQEVIK